MREVAAGAWEVGWMMGLLLHPAPKLHGKSKHKMRKQWPAWPEAYCKLRNHSGCPAQSLALCIGPVNQTCVGQARNRSHPAHSPLCVLVPGSSTAPSCQLCCEALPPGRRTWHRCGVAGNVRLHISEGSAPTLLAWLVATVHLRGLSRCTRPQPPA